MTDTEKPAPKITTEEVRHVARLARLNLSETDLPVFVNQLGNILGYVEKLSRVATESIPVTAQTVSLINAFREDLPEKRTDNRDSLTNAPVAAEGMYEVPKVID